MSNTWEDDVCNCNGIQNTSKMCSQSCSNNGLKSATSFPTITISKTSKRRNFNLSPPNFPYPFDNFKFIKSIMMDVQFNYLKVDGAKKHHFEMTNSNIG